MTKLQAGINYLKAFSYALEVREIEGKIVTLIDHSNPFALSGIWTKEEIQELGHRVLDVRQAQDELDMAYGENETSVLQSMLEYTQNNLRDAIKEILLK